MGLSASQARLLSITARLSDNELQSQQIANSKVRLADKSQEAGREYIEALDATQLMYNAYDLMGNAVQVNLSAAALYDFSPYKNQYTLVNSNNQLLVSATDVANYQTTNSLEEFLECYDVVDTLATGQLKAANNAQVEQYKENERLYNNANALYRADNDNPDAITGEDDYAKGFRALAAYNKSKAAFDAEYEKYVEENKDYIIAKNAYKAQPEPRKADAYTTAVLAAHAGEDGYKLEEDTAYGWYLQQIQFENYAKDKELYDFAHGAYEENISAIDGYVTTINNYYGYQSVDEYDDYSKGFYDLLVYDAAVQQWAAYDAYDFDAKAKYDIYTEITEIYANSSKSKEEFLMNIETSLGDSYSDEYGFVAYYEQQYDIAEFNKNKTLASNAMKRIFDNLNTLNGDADNSNDLGFEWCADFMMYLLYGVHHKPSEIFLFGDMNFTTSDGNTTVTVPASRLTSVLNNRSNYDMTDEEFEAVQSYLDAEKYSNGLGIDNAHIKDSLIKLLAKVYPTQMYPTTEAIDDLGNLLVDDINNSFFPEDILAAPNVTNPGTPPEYPTYAEPITPVTAPEEPTNVSAPEIKEPAEPDPNKYPEYAAGRPRIPSPPISPTTTDSVVITDKAKAQWYVNLWYRMNGSDTANMVNQLTSEDSSGAFTKTQYTVLMQKKANNTNGYAVLEDNLYRSSDWLQFALEQGIVTIQKATVYDPSEENGKVLSASGEAIMWTRTSHTSCTDFTFADDEIAIAKAEAEYKRKTDQIQAEDKKLDNDLKKLDTEHNALQTEYESVKSVVSKNIERSFKAFS